MNQRKFAKKIQDRTNTGRLRSHGNTSYFSLTALLILTGFILLMSTQLTSAWVRPGPAAGSVGVSGVMPGKPPKTAATITTPTNNQRFPETPIKVAGTCPAGSLVEIFKNDIFAGSVVCTEDGKFSLEVDLLIGENRLTARVFDALNQEGPLSNVVVVFYDALPPQSAPLMGLNFGGDQLIINTDAVFRGAFPGKEMSIPIDIIGGRAPYAVNVHWGDATNNIASRPDNSSFRMSHTYNKAGTFQLSIQATDADGRVAFLTVASIVNGQPDPVAVTGTTENPAAKNMLDSLMRLWPLYTATVAVVISFWLGEQRERRLLMRHGLLMPPPRRVS